MSNWENLASQAANIDAQVEATWKQLNSDLSAAVDAINGKVAENSPHRLSINSEQDSTGLVSKNGRTAVFSLNRANSTLAVVTSWQVNAQFMLRDGSLAPYGTQYPNLAPGRTNFPTGELVERVIKDVDLL